MSTILVTCQLCAYLFCIYKKQQKRKIHSRHFAILSHEDITLC